MPQKQFNEFFKILDNISQEFGNKFIIALSGGGDSIALCLLCKKYQELNPNIEFKAAIINHNIASNAAIIAQNALLTSQKIGIPAQIYKVEEKITTRMQEKAREYRYKLLGQAAKDFDAKTILIAHNLEDMVETFIFRLSRQTNLGGLGLMQNIAPNPFWGENKSLIIRPLLNYNRQELRDFLKAENIDYFNDPANINSQFSRVKIRQKLAELKSSNLDINKIIQTIKSANELNIKANEFVANFLKNIEISEKISIPLEIFKIPDFLFEKTIETLIYSIVLKKPDSKKLKNLCLKLKDTAFKKANLAGLNFIKKKNAFYIEIAKPRSGMDLNIIIEKTAIFNAIYAKTGQFSKFIDN